MEDEILYELGVDFDSSFSFENEDIKLISYDSNLVQSIANRLKTNLNELELFYEDYGSVMMSFLGWKANNETLEFIKSELETVLLSEDRITDWNFSIEYTGNGKLKIDLTLNPNLNYTINTIFEISNDNVEVIE